ncbi:MAG: hypothetical protein QF741_02570 [Candidatus Peribacteraceae bacterium]|jgi:hypothetical protein|nr:hypothetical protein [Candidatus Peribacteraceae bacterium]MDP7646071.1 hypothetical protein [Candidatus Peribacteraceae bacterium]|tara:strand:- start:73 stop:222 length:150 start_codon:yes stop_codon:yes gene_type:complete
MYQQTMKFNASKTESIVHVTRKLRQKLLLPNLAKDADAEANLAISNSEL